MKRPQAAGEVMTKVQFSPYTHQSGSEPCGSSGRDTAQMQRRSKREVLQPPTVDFPTSGRLVDLCSRWGPYCGGGLSTATRKLLEAELAVAERALALSFRSSLSRGCAAGPGQETGTVAPCGIAPEGHAGGRVQPPEPGSDGTDTIGAALCVCGAFHDAQCICGDGMQDPSAQWMAKFPYDQSENWWEDNSEQHQNSNSARA